VHEVSVHRTDAFDVLRELLHRWLRRWGATAAVELLRDEDVLRHLDGVLEEAVDVDDVDADELAPALDRLPCDLADVRHELQPQRARLGAALARAHVELDQPALLVERTMHGGRGLRDGGEYRGPVHPVYLAGHEGRVALDLDQLKVPRRTDHLVEHPP